jgi:hypothetical protein
MLIAHLPHLSRHTHPGSSSFPDFAHMLLPPALEQPLLHHGLAVAARDPDHLGRCCARCQAAIVASIQLLRTTGKRRPASETSTLTPKALPPQGSSDGHGAPVRDIRWPSWRSAAQRHDQGRPCAIVCGNRWQAASTRMPFARPTTVANRTTSAMVGGISPWVFMVGAWLLPGRQETPCGTAADSLSSDSTQQHQLGADACGG